MYYEGMPLYPGMRPPCEPSPCMRVRLFDEGCRGSHRPPPLRECERVVIDNPCRRGERAEVTLGMDDGGNLVICVRRLFGHGDACRPEPPAACPCASPIEPCPPRPLPQPQGVRHRHRPEWVCGR